jgi:hypothetical protein
MKTIFKIPFVIFLLAIITGFNTISGQQLIAEFPLVNNINDIGPNNYASSLQGNAIIEDNNLILPDDDFSFFDVAPEILNGITDFTIEFGIIFNGFHEDGAYPTNHIMCFSNDNALDVFASSYQRSNNTWYVIIHGQAHYFNPIEQMNVGNFYKVKITRNNGSLSFSVNNATLDVQNCSSLPLNVTSSIFGQEEDCYRGCFMQNQCTNAKLSGLKFYSGSQLTNITERSSKPLFFVHPNPANNIVNINAKDIDLKDEFNVELINSIGQIVKMNSKIKFPYYLNLDSRDFKGFCFLKILDKENRVVFTQKLIIN